MLHTQQHTLPGDVHVFNDVREQGRETESVLHQNAVELVPMLEEGAWVLCHTKYEKDQWNKSQWEQLTFMHAGIRSL